MELGVLELEISFFLPSCLLWVGGREGGREGGWGQREEITKTGRVEQSGYGFFVFSSSESKLSPLTLNKWLSCFLIDGIWAGRLWKFWHWGAKGRSEGRETVTAVNFGVERTTYYDAWEWRDFLSWNGQNFSLLLCFCSTLYIISWICKFSDH